MYDVVKYCIKIIILLITTLIFSFDPALAHHLRAGDITAELISCHSNIYIFTITGYTDPRVPLEFGYEVLDFGDGTFINLDTCASTKTDLGNNITKKVFKIEHAFPAPGQYTIRYHEPNRNDYVLNMTNSGYTAFYVETQVIIDPFLFCNNTPILLNDPVDMGAVGVIYMHNPAAWDPDGDSLVYKLVPCKANRDMEVKGFLWPHIHDIQKVNATNEKGTGPATFIMDPVSGDIIWDAPAIAGQYNIAFIVEEWRKIDGVWYKLGYVTRDMQIIIEESNNNRPQLIMPPDTCVEAGTVLNAEIKAYDPDNHDVIIEHYSGVFNLVGSAITLNPAEPQYQPNPAFLEIEWKTHCNHVREKPYQLVFKAKDNPTKLTEQPPLVDFGNWFVTIVAPAPQGLSAVLLPDNTVQLNWDGYTCDNAEKMQIWRRVSSYDFEYGNCEVGIPDYAGYELVGVVDIDDTTFIDNNAGMGLAYGADYCYRLVAVFPEPGGGESYPSEEMCITIDQDPQDKSFGPVITKVDIVETDENEGVIRIEWTSPFAADKINYPPPYTYEIIRAEGFTEDNNVASITGTGYPDTSFYDNTINTLNNIYNYRIKAYDANGKLIAVSSRASSVRVETSPILQGVELTWYAEVPWSINTQKYPWHIIFRDHIDPDDPDRLIILDSVEINTEGFKYTDKGQANDQPLEEAQQYCYYIQTLGSYGNPEIYEPLENRSQIICTFPNDTVAPCIPLVVRFGNITSVNDCYEFMADKPCDFHEFYNELFWEKNLTGNCDPDNSSFNIYFSTMGPDGPYEIIDNVRETYYMHKHLESFAGCYRISALDNSGNESELSDPLCHDNCPYYELPNVFTPNGDGVNDTFRAFDNPTNKCPRFVENIQFRVYNRWGVELYNSDINAEQNVFIDWDGRDFTGNLLDAGIYYFIAEVRFEALDPEISKHIYKGWVHLIR